MNVPRVPWIAAGAVLGCVLGMIGSDYVSEKVEGMSMIGGILVGIGFGAIMDWIDRPKN